MCNLYMCSPESSHSHNSSDKYSRDDWDPYMFSDDWRSNRCLGCNRCEYYCSGCYGDKDKDYFRNLLKECCYNCKRTGNLTRRYTFSQMQEPVYWNKDQCITCQSANNCLHYKLKNLFFVQCERCYYKGFNISHLESKTKTENFLNMFLHCDLCLPEYGTPLTQNEIDLFKFNSVSKEYYSFVPRLKYLKLNI